MLTSNEVIKERIFQTTSKKVLKSSEKAKTAGMRTTHILHQD
ncbi:hypothetical protein [Neisseria sicca]|nr:hypothetical protein [Neisseria sicca]